MTASRSFLEMAAAIDSDGVDEAAFQLGLDRIWNSSYHECRLGPGDDTIDYLLALPRSAAPAAASGLDGAANGFADSRRTAWAPIISLMKSWADGQSLLSVRSPTIWLEFDNPRAASPSPAVPSVSVCLVPDYRDDRPPLPADVRRDLRLVRESLMSLEREVPAALDSALSDCFARLPSRAQWIHLSVMLGRAACDVKLYGRFWRTDILPYLRAVEWAGNFPAIEEALERSYSCELVGPEIFVDLNLGNFRDPRRCSLGLAVAQQQLVSGPDHDPRWTRVLDAWTAAGLCVPAKVAACRDWPTEGIEVKNQGPWRRRSMRFLDLKLVWQAGLGLSAKAYLGARRWQGVF